MSAQVIPFAPHFAKRFRDKGEHMERLALDWIELQQQRAAQRNPKPEPPEAA